MRPSQQNTHEVTTLCDTQVTTFGVCATNTAKVQVTFSETTATIRSLEHGKNFVQVETRYTVEMSHSISQENYIGTNIK